MSKQRVIEVAADWVGLKGPILMGRLTATPARGKEVFAFEYDKAWLATLAPAYDMNADPQGEGLKLNISETDNTQDLDLAISVATVFRVKKKRAQELVNEVTSAVNQWRAVATSHGLARTAQDRMQRAFRVAEAWARS